MEGWIGTLTAVVGDRESYGVFLWGGLCVESLVVKPVCSSLSPCIEVIVVPLLVLLVNRYGFAF